MTQTLISLEAQIAAYAKSSHLDQKSLVLFPENVRTIHSYKLFGDNLLAIPTSLGIPGDEEEFEIPFSFLDSAEELSIFESEFRPDVPGNFIQIGNLYGATELVVLNKDKNIIHMFHAQDVVDEEWLKYKLEEKVICTFEELIENLRPQTVACFMDPKNHSKYELFEIRNDTEINYDMK
jgi:hypothetical protein